MAWRVIEKAPVMMAWLAITVASVARITSAINSDGGHSWKKDIPLGRRALQDDTGLAGIVENQGGKNDCAPGDSDRLGAEMPHVRVERFGAGYA